MNAHSTLNRFAAYALSLLLLASPSFVAAQDAPETPAFEPAFELGVDEMIEGRDLFDGAPGPRVEAVIANILLEERNAWREASADDAMAAQQTTPKQGGFGRWLKKRWYVPVLVAVVIGVAAADDSDSGELEDD